MSRFQATDRSPSLRVPAQGLDGSEVDRKVRRVCDRSARWWAISACEELTAGTDIAAGSQVGIRAPRWLATEFEFH
jgi:hypothetical protein